MSNGPFTTWEEVRKEGGYFIYSGDPKFTADSQEECEANCEAALINRFGEVGEGNCSNYQG